MAKHVGLFFQLPGSLLLCALLASLQVILPSLADALPSEGHVVAGQATIQKGSPTTLSIAQASDKAILNWNSFSIASRPESYAVEASGHAARSTAHPPHVWATFSTSPGLLSIPSVQAPPNISVIRAEVEGSVARS